MDDIDRSALDFFLALAVVGLLITALFVVKSASMEWKRQSAATSHAIAAPDAKANTALSQNFDP